MMKFAAICHMYKAVKFPLRCLMSARHLTMVNIPVTNNIKLVTSSENPLKTACNPYLKDPSKNNEEAQKQSKVRVVTSENERPIALIFSWMLAKEKHVTKFVKFYISNGYDVINISISPMQLLFPVSGSQAQRHSKVRVITSENERPVALVLSWMLAKERHVAKFSKFYVSNGFDVINVNVSPKQLLFPVTGSQVIAADLLKFLYTNKELKPKVVHGFSVGGYVFGEVLTHVRNQPNSFRPVLDSISAQVFDSAVDFEGIPAGLSRAMFPKLVPLRVAMEAYIRYHMKVMQNKATTHYMQSSMSFHGTIVKAPALFIYSKADPIGTEEGNLRLKESWENAGIQVQTKCFEKSPHVSHFYHHPEEYSTELVSFLAQCGLVPQNFQTCVSKMKEKL